MNIFQKIREVKLPFLAVIGAIVFGGIVAPASAAAPTISVTSTTPTATGVQINFTASGISAGSGCKVVVRATSSAAPASADIVSASSAVAPDVAYAFRSLTIASDFFTLTGLTASNNYSYYIVCFESAFANPTATPYTGTFTTSAAATAPAVVSSSSTTISSTSTQISITPDVAGYCKVVVRLAAAAAPTASYIMAATIPVSPDQAVAQGPVSANTAANFTLNGMMQGSSYYAYFACQDMAAQVTSSVFTFGPFTQQASGGSGSLPACQNATNLTGVRASVSTLNTTGSYQLFPGATSEINCSIAVTGAGFRHEIDGQLMRSTTFVAGSTNLQFGSASRTLSTLLLGNLNNIPVVDGSVYTLKYYAGLSAAPTSSDVPVATVSITLYPGIQGVVSQVTAAVQRPLPQINFAANPVNGVSARPTADTRKGTLTVEGSNLSDLTSITIGGKAATFTVKDGKLEIKLPAGVTGFPEVVMTNASGSITMQNAIEIYAPTVQKLTKFVGERLTLAGMETLENLYINNKTATALEATVVVAPDATEAEIAKAVAAATKAVTYIDKVGKRIVRTAVTVSKTGEAGTKPSIEMSFTK
jgi:hypothetical protein